MPSKGYRKAKFPCPAEEWKIKTHERFGDGPILCDSCATAIPVPAATWLKVLGQSISAERLRIQATMKLLEARDRKLSAQADKLGDIAAGLSLLD